MRKSTLILSGAIAMTSLGIWTTTMPQVYAEDKVTQGIKDSVNDATDAASRKMMEDVVADTTKAAMTKGGFDDLVERLADADRNRIGNYAEGDFPELDNLVASLTDAFKAKYNTKFDFDHESDVLSFIEFKEVKQDGKNSATITIPKSHDMPALTLPLASEAMTWRIDVDDSLTGQQLKDNLVKHLTMLNDSKADWPADVNDAYRMFTHHVLAALASPKQAEASAR